MRGLLEVHNKAWLQLFLPLTHLLFLYTCPFVCFLSLFLFSLHSSSLYPPAPPHPQLSLPLLSMLLSSIMLGLSF